jgi:glutathione S-transferase
MPSLELVVLSLRYSSWSIRPWLALHAAGASFEARTAHVPDLGVQTLGPAGMETSAAAESLRTRRAQGSVTGLFPVLRIDGRPVHEALAICEWVAEAHPAAGLWPDEPIERAQARAVSCEMATGFGQIRSKLYCHVFGRVEGFVPDAATRAQIERVFELWQACLDRSGGPFLFGRFGVPDCMYFPMLTRFVTYGVEPPAALRGYSRALYAHPSVRALLDVAREAPALPPYDASLRSLGGDPEAALRAATSPPPARE